MEVKVRQKDVPTEWEWRAVKAPGLDAYLYNTEAEAWSMLRRLYPDLERERLRVTELK